MRQILLFIAAALVGISSPSLLKSDENPRESFTPGTPRVLGRDDNMITEDGVILSVTYYPGAKGKESIPVVLLHDKNGTSDDFGALVPELVKQGMAVLVPDLRGHGKSTKRIVAGYKDAEAAPPPGGYQQPGAFLPAEDESERHRNRSDSRNQNDDIPPITKEEDYKFEDFTNEDYRDMAEYDMALLRSFLIHENNQERLNLNKLAIVGIDMGATLAAIWAKQDWTALRNRRAVKHAKCVIMLSPQESQVGKQVSGKPVRENIAFMIAVGKNSSESLENAQKLQKTILGAKADENQGLESRCPLILHNTERQGSFLFRQESPNLAAGIPLFIEDRIGKIPDKTKWSRVK